MSLPGNTKKIYQCPKLVTTKIEIGVFGTYDDANCGGGYTGHGGHSGHGGHGGQQHGGFGW